MTIHPIFGAGGFPAATASPPTTGAGHPALPPAATVQVSAEAGLLARLDLLARDRPGRFKAVMVDVATRLGAQASLADAPRAALLTRLAERFTAAAAAGSPAVLSGDPSPAVARPAPAAAGLPPGPSASQPDAAVLAAAGLAARGASAAKGSPRSRRPAPRRPGPDGQGDELAREHGLDGGGLVGLFRLVADVVQAALDAALLDEPEAGAAAAGSGQLGAGPGAGP